VKDDATTVMGLGTEIGEWNDMDAVHTVCYEVPAANPIVSDVVLERIPLLAS